MNGRIGQGAAVALALLVIACGHPDKRVVDQYFSAVNSNDTQTLTSFAAVNFGKKVQKWEVKQTLEEEKTTAPLADLLAKMQAADKALADNKKAASAYSLDHYSEIEKVREAEKKGQTPGGALAPVAAEWKKFNDQDKEHKKALAVAREAVEREKRNVMRSLGRGDDVDGLTGEMLTKKLLVALTVDGQTSDYHMTLRKYELKEAGGQKVMSRWVVQDLKPAS